jgi:histone H3/H4
MPSREVEKLQADMIPRRRNRKRKIIRDSIARFTQEAIRRLANRAGVPTLNSRVYEEIREMLLKYLENIVKKAIIVSRNSDRITILQGDVKYALEGLKIPVYETDQDGRMKKCELFEAAKNTKKHSRGELAIMRVKFYQDQAGCVLIEPSAFQTIVKEITQVNDEMKWSAKALNITQVATEQYLHDVFASAALCMIHAGRKTLFPEDLQLATTLRANQH